MQLVPLEHLERQIEAIPAVMAALRDETKQPTVAEEVANLISEMRAKAVSVDEMRDTVEIAALVRQIALPVLDPNAPPSFVPAVARATVLGAWIEHDRRKVVAQHRERA